MCKLSFTLNNKNTSEDTKTSTGIIQQRYEEKFMVICLITSLPL